MFISIVLLNSFQSLFLEKEYKSAFNIGRWDDETIFELGGQWTNMPKGHLSHHKTLNFIQLYLICSRTRDDFTTIKVKNILPPPRFELTISLFKVAYIVFISYCELR